MATTAGRLTYDDLVVIPQEREGDRQELICGELVVTPSPVSRHQRLATRLILLLGRYAETLNLGEVIAPPIDIRLAPDIVLIPDVVFIAQDRRHIVGPNTVDAAPDLVVEVLSPGTRQRDLTIKRDLYARFGVQEYWIVDPEDKSMMILALQGDRFETLHGDEEGVYASRVLPGLRLTWDDIFSGIVDR